MPEGGGFAKLAKHFRTGLKSSIQARVRAERGIGFEDVVFHIEPGDLLDILQNLNPDRYAGQRIFVVRREGYVNVAPFVEDEHTVFRKTMIPSRKATRLYIGRSRTTKIDADEGTARVRRACERNSQRGQERACPLTRYEGDVPQGRRLQHPAVEQGPGGDPEA